MLQAATDITSCDVIVTENHERFIIVCHIHVNIYQTFYKFRVHVYKITQ